uniref:Uncharacterized protein n=1 Tax=Anguilla anguilla TaxID=7936 RepID=A0A0E9T618_ANGAN
MNKNDSDQISSVTATRKQLKKQKKYLYGPAFSRLNTASLTSHKCEMCVPDVSFEGTHKITRKYFTL